MKTKSITPWLACNRATQSSLATRKPNIWLLTALLCLGLHFGVESANFIPDYIRPLVNEKTVVGKQPDRQTIQVLKTWMV
jgi:hypothetical protein